MPSFLSHFLGHKTLSALTCLGLASQLIFSTGCSQSQADTLKADTPPTTVTSTATPDSPVDLSQALEQAGITDTATDAPACYGMPSEAEMGIYSDIARARLNQADRVFLSQYCPDSRTAIARLAAAVNTKKVNRNWSAKDGESQLQECLYRLSLDAKAQLGKMNKSTLDRVEQAIAQSVVDAQDTPDAIYAMEYIAWDTMFKKYTTKINGDKNATVAGADYAAQLAADFEISVKGITGKLLGKTKRVTNRVATGVSNAFEHDKTSTADTQTSDDTTPDTTTDPEGPDTETSGADTSDTETEQEGLGF